MQNNAVNIYEKYFEELDPIELTVKSSAKTISVYRDYSELKRPCTRISWAEGNDFFVCSYLASQQASSCLVNDAYIWDAEYQNKPVYLLKAPQPAPCVEFNPKDIYILASGLHSGQIAIWDSRVGSDPIKITDREISHRDRVNTLLWSSTKTSSEFFTGSVDGDILW
jgi:dynein intermediate chain 2, axonemal